MENKMNHHYYYYSNKYYDGRSCSARLQIKDQEQLDMKTRQVQIVYYLSRNGQLEHPHFMELTLSSPYLRLRDILERLTALRGKDMPALYSWSCKRSYRNGYVWNDLTPNDVVYPTQGLDEYVLKGSQLPEKLQTIQVFNSEQNRTRAEQEMVVAYQEDDNSNSSYSFSAANTPPSRCSVGISTDDIQANYSPSPPPLSTSSSSSDKCIVEPSRSSVLLQLVACGGSNRCGMRPKQIENKMATVVVCKSPVSSKLDEDVAMIKCMSENPRFGGFQTENKEYFSGSIVEDVAAEERVAGDPSGLKRSNSFNGERGRKESGDEIEGRTGGLEEVKVERQMVMTGKCLPRIKKKQADHKC